MSAYSKVPEAATMHPRQSAPLSFASPSLFNKITMSAALVFACLASSAAAATAPTSNLDSCIPTGGYDATIDYFPQKATNFVNDGKQNLAIQYNNSYKVITNKLSNQVIVLYQCGAPKPTVAGANLTLPVPISSVAIDDTTVTTFLELLGERPAIKYSSSAEYITSPCLQAELASGSFQATSSQNATLAAQELNSVNVAFEFSTVNMTNAVLFPATTDPGAEHRLEWINLVGALFNKENSSMTIGQQILNNYNCISTAAVAAGASNSPKVVFATYSPVSSFSPNATWTINAPQYILDYITKAGATPVANASKTFYNPSDFLAAVADADIFVDQTSPVTVSSFYQAYGLSASSTQKFVANKKVFAHDKRGTAAGGSDWFESAVVLQNMVLGDVAAIAQPSLFPNANLYYFRNIFTDNTTVVAASSCQNPQAALTLPTVTCPTATSPTARSNAATTGFSLLAGAVVAAAAALFF